MTRSTLGHEGKAISILSSRHIDNSIEEEELVENEEKIEILYRCDVIYKNGDVETYDPVTDNTIMHTREYYIIDNGFHEYPIEKSLVKELRIYEEEHIK